MNSSFFNIPGGDQEQTQDSSANTGAGQEEVQVSLPQNDRPEGPFEHSGETSGWTKEEEAEVKKDGQQ